MPGLSVNDGLSNLFSIDNHSSNQNVFARPESRDLCFGWCFDWSDKTTEHYLSFYSFRTEARRETCFSDERVIKKVVKCCRTLSVTDWFTEAYISVYVIVDIR